MSILSHDIGFGWRQLRKRPLFTLLAVASMALGIGGNSAIFSLIPAAVPISVSPDYFRTMGGPMQGLL